VRNTQDASARLLFALRSRHFPHRPKPYSGGAEILIHHAGTGRGRTLGQSKSPEGLGLGARRP